MMSQLVDIFSEKVVQRKSFLREVYRRTQGEISPDVSYRPIAAALSFYKADIEQACVYLEAHGYLTVYSGTSETEKRLRLTDKGVSYVQQYCQDESAQLPSRSHRGLGVSV
jgi:hypothetical protein